MHTNPTCGSAGTRTARPLIRTCADCRPKHRISRTCTRWGAAGGAQEAIERAAAFKVAMLTGLVVVALLVARGDALA
ncbi:hypothetical protein BH23ACT9_BH23ACT9_16190 [soil metagenome]